MPAQVEEFTNIISSTLAAQVKEAQNGPLATEWEEMGREATSAHLTVVKKALRAHRSNRRGNIEVQQLMAVDNRRLRVGGYTGQLAVVYTSSYPDRLVRTWQLDSMLFDDKVPTERILLSDEEFDSVINWMKTPYLASDEISQFASLLPTEQEQVETGINHKAWVRASILEQDNLELMCKLEDARLASPDLYL